MRRRPFGVTASQLLIHHLTLPHITSPDLTWTITVPPLSPVLGLDNVLLSMLPICYLSTDLATPCSAAAHAARTPHSALPHSKDNHHKECNLTLVYCSLFVCTPLSSTKYRAWSDIIVTGDTDWSACTEHRALHCNTSISRYFIQIYFLL